MSDALQDELRRLQLRAYGPDADIHRDPTAIQRLRELEQAVGADGRENAAPNGRRPEVDRAEDPQGEDGGAATPTDGEPAPSATSTHAPARGRGWTRRRFVVAWAASVVCAVILGAGIAQLVDTYLPGGARHVATLSETSDFVWPTFIGEPTSQSRGYTEFHGMTVLASGPEWGGVGSDECLYVLPTAEAQRAEPMRRAAALGCGAGGFAATVQFAVTADLPDELIERFPVGTALQFVLTPLGVDVLAR